MGAEELFRASALRFLGELDRKYATDPEADMTSTTPATPSSTTSDFSDASMPPSTSLVEVDSLEITVLVNDETVDMSHGPRPGNLHCEPAAAATKCMQTDSACCGAHGLSLAITATRGAQKHTLLLDAGPDGAVFEHNARQTSLAAAAAAAVEHVVLSHWHPSHSGGLVQAVRTARAAAVVVDVHPDRPARRGLLVPGLGAVALGADPTLDEMEAAGGRVLAEARPHAVLDAMFLVSGEVPRAAAPYEAGGIVGGARFVPGAGARTGAWVADELIGEERFVMANLKGKGLVVFTGCSHAGVINVSRHALELGGGAVPLYSVVGGFHLADAPPERLKRSVRDLLGLGPKVLMPGHCTGWRFRHMVEQEKPGCVVPILGGATYEL